MQGRSGALPSGSQLQDGKYIIKAVLGEGGFGITYRATAVGSRLHPDVAIKELFVAGSQRVDSQVVHPPALSEEAWDKLTANFEREAQTIARLRHPSIVPVYDCFEENNALYIVMGFVLGTNLDRITRKRGGMLPEAQALRYVVEVADALAVLHANGVLHRDVKPGNILINEHDQAVLIDFGNARDFVADKAITHSVILTPGFAPPEQFQAQARRGPFTDIYALAATCYWLLTGDVIDSWDNSKVRNDPRLSPQVRNALVHALVFNAQDRTPDAATFTRELLAPSPALPASPISPAFSAPVRTPSYQSTPAVRPAAPGAAYPRPPAAPPSLRPVASSSSPGTGPQPIVRPARTLWQLQGRDLWLTVASSIVVVALVLVIIFMVATSGRNATIGPLFASSTPTQVLATASPTVTAVGTLPPTQLPATGEHPSLPSIAPPLLPTNTPIPPPLPTGTPVPLPGAWEATVLNGHSRELNSAVFSPDGKLILTAANDNTARLWDLQGKQLAVLNGHTGGVHSAVFSPDGKLILTASDDGTARLWDLQGKPLAALKGHTQGVVSAVFSPDGKQVLTASADGTARLWDLQGKQLAVLSGHTNGVNGAVFSPEGKLILTASADGSARLWDLHGKQLAALITLSGGVLRAVFSPDGKLILTASWDKTARLWDKSGKLLAILSGHTDIVTSAVFSPDGQLILTASLDSTARLWDKSGKPISTLSGHTNIVTSAVFSPDGPTILTTSFDKTARLWDKQGLPLATLSGHTDIVTSAVFSPDGQLILTASFDKTARLWHRVK